MSGDNGNRLEEAKEKLRQLKEKKINSSRPANIQKLAPSKHAKRIQYFPEMTNDVKRNFKSNESNEDILKFNGGGPTGCGIKAGQIWHENLKKAIDNPQQRTPQQEGGSTTYEDAAHAVIEALKTRSVVNNIEFLQTEFPLYGFMQDKDNDETFFWKGKADAIGWLEDNYVIVEWKAVDLLHFWDRHRDAYGDYLHQCIVYACLLKLHLNLQELPYVLIVPISNKTGKDCNPTVFRKFPQECTGLIAEFEWCKSWAELKYTKKIEKSMIKDEHHSKENLDDTKVIELFKANITVRDLLDELGLEKFELKIREN